MDRRSFLATAAALPAAMLGTTLAWAEDHLKWAVFTPDSEVTFRTVMKPFAETVQREASGAVVSTNLFPNGALGRNPGQQPQMLLDGVADLAWVIPSYSPGRFPDTRSPRTSRPVQGFEEVVPCRERDECAQIFA